MVSDPRFMQDQQIGMQNSCGFCLLRGDALDSEGARVVGIAVVEVQHHCEEQ